MLNRRRLMEAAGKKEFRILRQPEDQYKSLGENAVFHVEVEGENLSFQWQYKSANQTSYYNSGSEGCRTDTLTIGIISTRNNQAYRCIIRSGDQELISQSAKIIIV